MKAQRVNHEDLIMKKAMALFADEGLKFLGINEKVKDSSITEIVVLQAKNLHMDYTFLMENDIYIHIEFQTTDKKSLDLMRFRAYESLLSLQSRKEVKTYVVYSNINSKPITSLKTGFNEYKVKTILMSEKNGDNILKILQDKLDNNRNITKQDLIALTFTPIMGGKISKFEKILKAIQIIKKVDTEYKYDIESMIYAFADKFLKGKELQKIKEEIIMTELGKMIINDGIEKGIEKGRQEGKIQAARNLLDILTDEVISEKLNLDIELVRKIRKEKQFKNVRKY